MTPPTDAITDADLLRAMRAGDENAFVTLYRRHHRAVFQFAWMRTGRREAADDIVQEIFMGLITARYAFDPLRGSLQGFLLGIARNLVLKMDRSDARWVHGATPDGETDFFDTVESPQPHPDDVLLQNETAEVTRRALRALAPHYRDVIILYELHQLSYIEIAQICQIDLGTVRSRLSRGREKLLELLSLEGSIHAPQHHPKKAL